MTLPRAPQRITLETLLVHHAAEVLWTLAIEPGAFGITSGTTATM